MRVTADQLLCIETHKYVAEASELGIPVGKWPAQIETELGNMLPFDLIKIDESGGAIYQQRLGILKLTVLND